MPKKLLLLLMIITVNTSTAQCAMCKAVVQNGDPGMAQGVNNGITYLMIFPYLLVGILFFMLYRYKKRANS
ncbi:MAG: hypothetical protein ACWIPI_05575 [Polaribacter sp.]